MNALPSFRLLPKETDISVYLSDPGENMKRFFRFFWFGALILLLAVTACAPTNLTPFPTPPGFQPLTPNAITATPPGTNTTSTAIAETPSVTETAAATETVVSSPTSGAVSAQIPVTGLHINVLDGPFCVNEKAYTMLLMPDTSTYKVVSNTSSNPPTCTTVDVASGKQVVMCAGSKKSSFTLNVCTNTGGCADYPMTLIDCIVPGLFTKEPVTDGSPATPTNTLLPAPTDTSTSPPIATDTAIPSDTVTPTP
jgi:hypothetical protein